MILVGRITFDILCTFEIIRGHKCRHVGTRPVCLLPKWRKYQYIEVLQMSVNSLRKLNVSFILYTVRLIKLFWIFYLYSQRVNFFLKKCMSLFLFITPLVSLETFYCVHLRWLSNVTRIPLWIYWTELQVMPVDRNS